MMGLLLATSMLVYYVPLESAGGERIGDLIVEEDAPDGSRIVKCKELPDDKEWAYCLVRYPNGAENWATFWIGQ